MFGLFPFGGALILRERCAPMRWMPTSRWAERWQVVRCAAPACCRGWHLDVVEGAVHAGFWAHRPTAAPRRSQESGAGQNHPQQRGSGRARAGGRRRTASGAARHPAARSFAPRLSVVGQQTRSWDPRRILALHVCQQTLIELREHGFGFGGGTIAIQPRERKNQRSSPAPGARARNRITRRPQQLVSGRRARW